MGDLKLRRTYPERGDKDLNFIYWNIASLRGSIRKLAKKLSRLHSDLLCLLETRWKDCSVGLRYFRLVMAKLLEVLEFFCI